MAVETSWLRFENERSPQPRRREREREREGGGLRISAIEKRVIHAAKRQAERERSGERYPTEASRRVTFFVSPVSR